MASTWSRRLLHGVALVLTAIVLVGLFRALRRDGPAALDAWRSAHIRWSWTLLSALLSFAGQAIYVVGWRRLLTDCGVAVSFWTAARIFLVSNFGRYLPGGKAWQMGIVGVMAAENNLPAALLATTSLFQGMVGVAVGAVLLVIAGGSLMELPVALMVLALTGIGGLIALPALLRVLPALRDRVVSKLPGLDSVTGWTMWALVWTTVLSWLAWGVALRALATGLLPDPVASIAGYVTAWIGPFLGGLIAIFAPAGLGVREEMMRSVLSAAGLAPGAALIVVVVSRVWATALEVVPAAIVLLAARFTKKASSSG